MANCSGNCATPLILVNERVGNQGTLQENCRLYFETYVLEYIVTFSGPTQYQLQRRLKGNLDWETIGYGMEFEFIIRTPKRGNSGIKK